MDPDADDTNLLKLDSVVVEEVSELVPASFATEITTSVDVVIDSVGTVGTSGPNSVTSAFTAAVVDVSVVVEEVFELVHASFATTRLEDQWNS